MFRIHICCVVVALGAVLASCGGGGGSSGSNNSGSAQGSSSTSSASSSSVSQSGRIMEKLGRGVVAVRNSSTEVFISWRLLGLEPQTTAFNVYRSTNGGPAVKLNDTPLVEGTNFTDLNAPNGTLGTYEYTVRALVDDVEQAPSAPYKLAINGPSHPIVRVPLSTLPGTNYYTKFLWVGDLDGDGEYDYVIDRLAPEVPGTNGDLGAGPQYLEAYKRDGTRLWQINMGPGSLNIYNITPGPTTMSVGMYDGVTVYDLNGDGKAEVVLRIADGVTFGNGSTFNDADPNRQHLAILDGLTGVPLATRPFPDDYYVKAGRMGVQLGIGYANGQTPNIFFWGRNRNPSPDKTFNDVFASYSWSGGSTITEHWRLPMHQATYAGGNASGTQHEASHQMRIIDVDGDGKDEMATGNFLLNGDGTMRYVLPGVGHGDRFYIGKFSSDHAGMRGFGVQQNHPSGLLEYYYNATTGEVLWTHSVDPADTFDVGRGMVGDIDPRFPGFEVWTTKSGIYNGESNTRTVTTAQDPLNERFPWPHQMIWWDGDLLSELVNEYRLEKWDYLNPQRPRYLPRLVTLNDSSYSVDIESGGKNPIFFGDIFGDWRTELVYMGSAQDELVIFTTGMPSSYRLYTLAHNPAYRNHMTIKGYVQSPLPDYYLGTGMTLPPPPDIRYAGD